MNPENIKSFNVSKDKEEVAKYSTKDYDGVVVITLKEKK